MIHNKKENYRLVKAIEKRQFANDRWLFYLTEFADLSPQSIV